MTQHKCATETCASLVTTAGHICIRCANARPAPPAASGIRYLVQGSQTEERLAWLLKLTKISSEDVIDALRIHLVKGLAESTAAHIADVKLSNLKRALDTLNETAEAVEKIKEIDWRSFRSDK